MAEWFYAAGDLDDALYSKVVKGGYVTAMPRLYPATFKPGNEAGYARFFVKGSVKKIYIYGEKRDKETLQDSRFKSQTSLEVNPGPAGYGVTIGLPRGGWEWEGEDKEKDPENSNLVDRRKYSPPAPASTSSGRAEREAPAVEPARPDAAVTSGGGESAPAVAQARPPSDTVIPGDNLVDAAKALNNTYKHLASDPVPDPATGRAVPTGDVVKRLVAAAPGDNWSAAHVELIFAGAAELSDPNLAAFRSAVSSADAKITERAVKALKDYVVAKMDAGYGAAIKVYAKDANDGPMGTSAATRQDNVFAAALACIVPDIVGARRKSRQDAAEASPQLQSIWPTHDDRDTRAREYAAQIPVMAGLDIGVATHPGDPAIYGLPPSEVVLTMFADPSSFAEKIKELPGLFSPRGGRTRRERVRGGAKIDESRILREATVDPGTMDTTFFGITAIPTQGLRSGTIPTSLKEPDRPSADAPPEAAPEFTTSELPDLSFDEAEISPPPPTPPAAAPPAQPPPEEPPAPEETAEPYAVSDLPDLTIPEDEEQAGQGQTAQTTTPPPAPAPAPQTPATPSAATPPAPAPATPPLPETKPPVADDLVQGPSLTVPDAQPPAAAPVVTAPPVPPTAAPAGPMAPGSIGTACSAVVSSLALSYQAWDLLSLQEGEDYYVAEEVRVAFQQGRPSMSGLKELSSDAIARTVVVQIKYQGRFRTIDNAFLSQPGTGGIAAKAVFGATASAKQGALKFIECFAIDGMDSAGFFAR